MNLPPPELSDASFDRFDVEATHLDEEFLYAAMNRFPDYDSARPASGVERFPLPSFPAPFDESMFQSAEDFEAIAQRLCPLPQPLMNGIADRELRDRIVPEPTSGPRPHQLLGVVDLLKHYLLVEKAGSSQPPEESAAASALLTRLFELGSRLHDLGSETRRITELEGEIWRVAVEVRAYAHRHHLVIACPEFDRVKTFARPESLFLSGGDALSRTVEQLAGRRPLAVFGTSSVPFDPQARWDQLCSASVALFDFGVKDDASLAQVAYELGLALAIGKAVLVIPAEGEDLPFDADLPSVSLTGDDAVEKLDQAILAALVDVPLGPAHSARSTAPADGLAWLDRHLGRKLTCGALGIARQMAERSCDDIVSFQRVLGQFLDLLGADAPMLLLPTWSPPRRTFAEGCCFHSLPVSRRWSAANRDKARAICLHYGWRYSRAGGSGGQRNLRRVWNKIVSSTAVLIDITGRNPGGAVALGFVHALGRPYRVVALGDPALSSFPGVEGVHVHSYQPWPSFAGLERVVEELLSSSSVTQEPTEGQAV